VFVLIAPESAGADHLTALARAARLLRDPVLVSKLRATRDPSGIYTLFTEQRTSHAA
jgi:PTS system nitrogen regulatory IIA component